MNAELDRILKEQNLFLILNLTNDVSPEVHPDRIIDSDDKTKAEEAFKRVGIAFNTLKDPFMRKDYERSLERIGGTNYGQSSRQSTTSSPPPPPSSSTTSGPVRPPGSPPPGTGPIRPPGAQTPPSGTGPMRPPGTGPINQDAQATAKREQMITEQADQHYQAGRDFERKNLMEDAVKEYQEAIRLKKETAKYHSRLGFALEKKGWGGYAQAEYKVALHFDPTDKLALKSYRPTAGGNQSKGAGLKFTKAYIFVATVNF